MARMAIRVSGQPQKHGASLADEIATWLLRFSGNPLKPDPSDPPLSRAHLQHFGGGENVEHFLYIKQTIDLVPEHPHQTHCVNPSSITSKSCIGTIVMFPSLKKSRTLSEPKLHEASKHPDKGVCQYGLLILVMSFSSEALLDHVADYLQFIFNAQSFWFTLNTSMTMAATLPAYSVWTRKTTRLCPLLSCCPRVVSSYQLVVASPLVVLSLRRLGCLFLFSGIYFLGPKNCS